MLVITKGRLVESRADPRLLCVNRSDLCFSSQCAISLASKEAVAAFLAAAWINSPACEWEHFHATKLKLVQVCNVAPRITAFVTNVSVKGIH